MERENDIKDDHKFNFFNLVLVKNIRFSFFLFRFSCQELTK